MRSLRAAVAFLTRLPVGGEVDEADLARGLVWFPLVGAAIGGVLVLVASVVALAGAPPGVVLVAVLVTGPLVTGALHEDALADTADALGGGRDRNDVLRIMRDSRIGSYGGLALVLLVVGRAACLSAMPLAAWPAALVLSHAIARWTAPVVFFRTPYIRPEGTGRAMAATAGTREVAGATAIAIAIAVIVGRAPGVWCLAAAAVVAVLAAALFRRRLGGVTGDALGATIAVTEVVVLAVQGTLFV